MSIAWKNSAISADERCAARDGEPQPAAEALLDLRVHEPVGEAVLRCEPARHRLAGPAERADAPTDAERPVDQLAALRRSAASNLATTAAWTFS